MVVFVIRGKGLLHESPMQIERWKITEPGRTVRRAGGYDELIGEMIP